MATDDDRLRSASGGRLLLAADAFLFSAAFDITLTGIVLGAIALSGMSADELSESMFPLLGSILSLIATAAMVFAGAILAWRMHGRAVDAPTIAGMFAGAFAGFVVASSLLVGASMLLSRIPIGGEDSPPWAAIGVLIALVVAFLAIPLVDAARDAGRTRRMHVRLDWARAVAVLAVALFALVLLPLIGARMGGEAGEAGIFMVPFAATGAFAVLGADILDSVRRKQPEQSAPTAPV